MIRPLTRGQLVFDLVLPTIIFLIGLIPVSRGYDSTTGPFVLFGLCLALVFRRWIPLASLGIAWAVALIEMAAAQTPSFTNVLILGVLFACGAYGDSVTRWIAFGSSFVGAALVSAYLFALPFLVSWPQDNGMELNSVVINGAVAFGAALAGFLLAWTLGLLSRSWRRVIEGRKVAVEADREIAAEQERTRIARDMHDVVAHSLAVVIAQADGARYLRKTDPEAVDEALSTIASTSREALADVRVLLAQLRHSQGDAPQPVLADLDRLFEQLRGSGLEVRQELSGSPLPLGTSTQLAVYRIVQESLTNALRHGDPLAPVLVRFDWAPGGLHLSISSGLRAAGPSTGPVASSGHGIVGMTERALLVGGTLSAAGTAGRFTVRAWLPADMTGAIQVVTGSLPTQTSAPRTPAPRTPAPRTSTRSAS